MQCKEINNLMMKYFDGNISEIELEQLLRHNQKCLDCTEEFEILKDAIYSIATLPEIDPPLELTANIMTAVGEQRHFNVNSIQLICGIIGFVGLVFFTYNIIAYVIFPMMGAAPLVSFHSVLDFIYMLAEKAKDGFVAFSLYLGKLLVIRDTLFREHIVFMFLWLSMFAIVGLLLYRLINMKDRNGFVNIK